MWSIFILLRQVMIDLLLNRKLKWSGPSTNIIDSRHDLLCTLKFPRLPDKSQSMARTSLSLQCARSLAQRAASNTATATLLQGCAPVPPGTTATRVRLPSNAKTAATTVVCALLMGSATVLTDSLGTPAKPTRDAQTIAVVMGRAFLEGRSAFALLAGAVRRVV